MRQNLVQRAGAVLNYEEISVQCAMKIYIQQSKLKLEAFGHPNAGHLTVSCGLNPPKQ